MKLLLIVVSLFFLGLTGLAVYFTRSGPGQEYDMKVVLSIDTRNMPAEAQVESGVPLVQGTGAQDETAPEARAGTPEDFLETEALLQGQPAGGAQ
jgi:hypothetical protein